MSPSKAQLRQQHQQQLSDLQSQNDKLQKLVEDLTRKMEALAAGPSTGSCGSAGGPQGLSQRPSDPSKNTADQQNQPAKTKAEIKAEKKAAWQAKQAKDEKGRPARKSTKDKAERAQDDTLIQPIALGESRDRALSPADSMARPELAEAPPKSVAIALPGAQTKFDSLTSPSVM